MHAHVHADAAFDEPTADAPEVPRTETGLRLLYSSVFALILHVVAGIVSMLVVLQLALALVTRQKPHPRLAQFGRSMTRYAADVVSYLTYNRESDEAPFPFSDFPEDGPPR